MNARKWFLLTLAAAIAITAIVWRCLSVPHETISFRFVDAFNGRPLRVTVAMNEETTPYFRFLGDTLQLVGLLPAPARLEHACPDGILRQVRLAKHPRRQTRMVCSSPFHQTGAVLYCNGTNRLDAIGWVGSLTNYGTCSLILDATNGLVTVPLYRFTDYPLN